MNPFMWEGRLIKLRIPEKWKSKVEKDGLPEDLHPDLYSDWFVEVEEMLEFSEREIDVAANAIGWVFFAEGQTDGVQVTISNEDAKKCLRAAKIALKHVAEYRNELQ